MRQSQGNPGRGQPPIDSHATALRRLRCAYKIVEGLAELTPATKVFVTLGKTIYELSKEADKGDQGSKQNLSVQEWSLLQQKIDQILASLTPPPPSAPTLADRSTENLLELSFACPVAAVSFHAEDFHQAVSITPIKTEDSSYFAGPKLNVSLATIASIGHIHATKGGQFTFDGNNFSFTFPNGRSRLLDSSSTSFFEEGVEIRMPINTNKTLEVSQFQDDPRGTLTLFAARTQGIDHRGNPSVEVEGLPATSLVLRRGIATNPGDPYHTFYFLSNKTNT
jgi:hypothetical protein